MTATEGNLLNLLAELSVTFMKNDSQERALPAGQISVNPNHI